MLKFLTETRNYYSITILLSYYSSEDIMYPFGEELGDTVIERVGYERELISQKIRFDFDYVMFTNPFDYFYVSRSPYIVNGRKTIHACLLLYKSSWVLCKAIIQVYYNHRFPSLAMSVSPTDSSPTTSKTSPRSSRTWWLLCGRNRTASVEVTCLSRYSHDLSISQI